MKFYFKSMVLAGFLTSILANGSYGLEQLMEVAQQRDEDITSLLRTQMVMPDEETTHALFEDGVTWGKRYQTADGNELKLEFTYDPRQKNDEVMPSLLWVEQNHETVAQHFMEELSRKINPSIAVDFPEGNFVFDTKAEYLKSFKESSWLEQNLKLPQLAPEQLYQDFLSKKEQTSLWAKLLHKHLNEKPLKPVSLIYSVPANPGFLKKYYGKNVGPMMFKADDVSGESSSRKTSKSSTYGTDLNYGTFTLSITKNEPNGSVSAQAMPVDLATLIEDFDSSIKCQLNIIQSYAQHSYGHSRDNSNRMVL